MSEPRSERGQPDLTWPLHLALAVLVGFAVLAIGAALLGGGR